MSEPTTHPSAQLLRLRRQQEDAWSLRRMDAEEQFGLDSPEERTALERATDYAVEVDMLLDMLVTP